MEIGELESSIEQRLGEFTAFEQAMKAQAGFRSELAQVLISASYLDNQIRQILEAFFVKERSSKDLLEGGTAPVSTFSARVLLSYTLGLITDQEYGSITAIRKIRNEFAHEITTSFDSNGLTKHFDRLAWVIGENVVGKSDRSQILFLAAVRLGMGLVNRADHVRAERRSAKDWPIERIDADPDLDPLDIIY